MVVLTSVSVETRRLVVAAASNCSLNHKEATVVDVLCFVWREGSVLFPGGGGCGRGGGGAGVLIGFVP